MRRLALAAFLLALGGALNPCFAQAPAPDAARPDRILVMPFENVKRDGSIFWLGEASSVLLADDLNAFGLNAITRPERQQAFERLQVPSSAVLTDATVIRIAQLVGAAQVIVGSIQRDADGLVVRARSLSLDAGRLQADVTEHGPIADLFAILDRIAQGLARSFPGASIVSATTTAAEP